MRLYFVVVAPDTRYHTSMDNFVVMGESPNDAGNKAKKYTGREPIRINEVRSGHYIVGETFIA